MRYRYLFPGMTDYPPGLGRAWRSDPLPVLTVAGDTELLRRPSVCLLSSSEVPPDLILPSFDLALRLRDAGVPIAGGFQGEVEGACLQVLLRGSGPLVICPARSLDGINPKPEAQARVAARRLAYVSSERPTCRRPTSQAAMRRNDLVVGLADRLIILSAPPGSRALRSGAELVERGRPVACFDHRRNRDLLLLGALPIPPDSPVLRPVSLRGFRRFQALPGPLEEFLSVFGLSGIEPVSGIVERGGGAGGVRAEDSGLPAPQVISGADPSSPVSRASRASR